MNRADDRVTAALLEHADLPDLTAVPIDELFDQLALVPAQRAEAGVNGVAIVGELRRRQATFDAIRARTGLSVGTAHRWSALFEKHAKTQSTTQGENR